MDLLAAVVGMQLLRIEHADGLAGGEVPLLHLAHEVAGEEELAVGMEGDAVNVQLVAGEFLDHFPVGEVPEFHEPVVAAAGEVLAVRADGERANPAFVRRDLALRFGLLRRGGPPDEGVVCTGADERLAVLRHCQRPHVGVVRGEDGLLFGVGQFPAQNRAILGGGEHKPARGIEAAGDERRRVVELGGDVGGFEVGFHERLAATTCSVSKRCNIARPKQIVTAPILARVSKSA